MHDRCTIGWSVNVDKKTYTHYFCTRNRFLGSFSVFGGHVRDSFYPPKSPSPSFFSSKKSLPLFFTRQESHCFFLLFIVVFLFFAKRSPYPSFLFFRKVFGGKAFAPSYSFGKKSLAQSFFPAKRSLPPRCHSHLLLQ